MFYPTMATTPTVTTLFNEVGESIPPNTAHVIPTPPHTLAHTVLMFAQGCICLFTDMESEYRVRRRRRLGLGQDEDWLSAVRQLTLQLQLHIAVLSPHYRFFIHKSIEAFSNAIVGRHGSPTESALLFPSRAVATRCIDFIHKQLPYLVLGKSLRVIDLYPNASVPKAKVASGAPYVASIISAVMFPRSHFKIAKAFWQHSGDGISSRRAEYCHKAFDDGHLTIQRVTHPPSKGPRRYQNKESIDTCRQCTPLKRLDGKDCTQFVEERFGRNLDVSLACNAKLAIRRRIAGILTANVDLHEALEMSKPPTRTEHVEGFSENDVYLYPCGMSSIFNAHRTLMACKGELKSISYGYAAAEGLVIPIINRK